MKLDPNSPSTVLIAANHAAHAPLSRGSMPTRRCPNHPGGASWTDFQALGLHKLSKATVRAWGLGLGGSSLEADGHGRCRIRTQSKWLA